MLVAEATRVAGEACLGGDVKRYALPIILAVAVLLTGTAFARIPALSGQSTVAPTSAPVGQKVTVRKQSAVKQFPPLKLPDVTALTRALIKEPDRKILTRQRVASSKVIAFWEGRGKWLRAVRKEKCWEVPWQRSCTVARASWRLHTSLLAVADHRLAHELPTTNDWQTAVRIAQRVYPGTADWMLAISDREGGWSSWVWYGGREWNGYHIGNDFLGADTVGGWMQFRFSTFAPYYRGMIKDLRARGIEIPPFPNRGGPAIYQPWLDPLGQALTAGYMRYYGKDGCHWCL